MKVLALGRYDDLGASSRLRMYQFEPYLKSRGYDIQFAPFLPNSYLTALYQSHPTLSYAFRAYWGRLTRLLTKPRADIVWIEKELLPWIPFALEEPLLRSMHRIVIDYDDAVFHLYDGHKSHLVRAVLGSKIKRLMQRADAVAVGNNYLAQYARSAGSRRTEIIPTVVDTNRYVPVTSRNSTGAPVVGWIGTPLTAKYLNSFIPLRPNLLPHRFVAVGASSRQFESAAVETRPWSATTEVEEIQSFDIGIMPLPDEPFERGKCGYKLIQYMACGIPVVASPVGANIEIVRNGVDGFLANSAAEWMEAMQTLLSNSNLRESMGRAARQRVISQYSLTLAASKLDDVFSSVGQ